MSILGRVWRPAVGENFPLQQASESLHEEAWVGRVNSSNMKISKEVEIGPGCCSVVRSWLEWTLMVKTDRSGLWLFRCALRGGDVFLLSLLHVTG